MKNAIKKFWDSEDGMGVVEVVLITIVLVGLVVVFKKQITSLVNSILSKMIVNDNNIFFDMYMCQISIRLFL